VTLLLDQGAELNTKDSNGQTPLSWAIRSGHEPVVTLLVEKGADLLETKDNDSWTSLWWAVRRGH
jgi:ankyrin repeat protein